MIPVIISAVLAVTAIVNAIVAVLACRAARRWSDLAVELARRAEEYAKAAKREPGCR
jgi:hypothetical protein